MGFIGNHLQESAYIPTGTHRPAPISTPTEVGKHLTEEQIKPLISTWVKERWEALAKPGTEFSAMVGLEGEKRVRETLRQRAKRAIEKLPSLDSDSVQAALSGLDWQVDPTGRKKAPADPDGSLASLMRSVFKIMKRDGPHCPEGQRPDSWRRSMTTRASKIWDEDRDISARELARKLKSPRGGR